MSQNGYGTPCLINQFWADLARRALGHEPRCEVPGGPRELKCWEKGPQTDPEALDPTIRQRFLFRVSWPSPSLYITLWNHLFPEPRLSKRTSAFSRQLRMGSQSPPLPMFRVWIICLALFSPTWTMTSFSSRWRMAAFATEPTQPLPLPPLLLLARVTSLAISMSLSLAESVASSPAPFHGPLPPLLPLPGPGS